MTRDSGFQRTLKHGWTIQASAEVAGAGNEISALGFDTAGWLPTSVPSTVLAALVANGRYRDLYVGTNLRDVPRAQFEEPWWYRTEFALSEEEAARIVLLEFDWHQPCGQHLAQREAHRGHRRGQRDLSTISVRCLGGYRRR